MLKTYCYKYSFKQKNRVTTEQNMIFTCFFSNIFKNQYPCPFSLSSVYLFVPSFNGFYFSHSLSPLLFFLSQFLSPFLISFLRFLFSCLYLPYPSFSNHPFSFLLISLSSSLSLVLFSTFLVFLNLSSEIN